MSHSCGQFSLNALFERSSPQIRDTYDALERLAREVAPFHVIPQKTRVCFQLRTRCAACSPFKSYLRFHFLSRAILAHPRIVKVETFAPDQHVHYVNLASPEEVDDQIREWLTVSTEYGEQRNRRMR